VGQGVEGRTVLEVGGGVGAVHLALLEAGAKAALEVEASKAFLRAAKAEAARRGLGPRVTHQHGDFVDLASGIAAADIVALDRVICCYDDAMSLLELAAKRTKGLLSLVYPRDNWLSRLINWAFNLKWARQACEFRTYVHPRQTVEAVIRSQGLDLVRHIRWGFWQVAVFSRSQ
jgi:magnesium-protoporphyrin O-methyltransferase